MYRIFMDEVREITEEDWSLIRKIVRGKWIAGNPIKKEINTMKDINGNEIHVGCAVDIIGTGKREVVYVSEVFIGTLGHDKCYVAEWSAHLVKEKKVKVVQSRFLGKDFGGNDVHLGDIVTDMGYNREGEVLDYKKSITGDGWDYYFIENRKAIGGWTYLAQTRVKLIRKKYPVEPIVKITIEVNGKEVNPSDVSEETWTRIRKNN